MYQPGGMEIRKFLWRTAFILAALAVGAYLLSGRQQIRKELAGLDEKVTVGLALQAPSALFIIAQDQGLFSKEGLHMVVKEYPSGKRAIEGMLRGEVEVSTTAETPVVFSSFIRQDFRIVGSIGSTDNISKFVARKDSGIHAPADLRGKRIAVQEASAVHFYCHLFFLKHGITEKEVELSFIKVEAMPEMLSRGEIDGSCGREPFISRTKALLGYNAVVLAEKGLYQWTEEVVASDDFLRKKPEVIKRMLSALVKAEGFARNNPKSAIKLVSSRLEMSASEIAELWPDMNLRVSLDQALILSLEDEARWAIKNKLTDKTEVPNYLNFIYVDGLKAVRPESVTIIR